jgi:hypothetical protein
MNRRGHCGRVDGNHGEIMETLRDAAISAVSLAAVGDGCPDILAGFRGTCIVLEVKMPGAKLTAAEEKWHAKWSGPVAIVTTPEEAVIAVLNHAKRMGAV